MVLYGWKLQPLIYFRDFIIVVSPLELRLPIKSLSFLLFVASFASADLWNHARAFVINWCLVRSKASAFVRLLDLVD